MAFACFGVKTGIDFAQFWSGIRYCIIVFVENTGVYEIIQELIT